MPRYLEIAIIVITSPLIFALGLIVAVAVRLTLSSPVIFVQIRPGKDGVPFKMYKFRTMRDLRNKEGELLSDEDRLTKFGAFLRSTSLDELPEIWNVIKGDMSLVGPRPLLMEYLPLYNEEQNRRHEVRSGITGWAQVNGRNAISWEEKFALDVWYVDNKTVLLDLKILFLTVKKMIKRDGVNQAGNVTMSRFRGKL
jgi:lipopolysaccharide/colanic/teichoic acid biosynthesis glycosyltransferase